MTTDETALLEQVRRQIALLRQGVLHDEPALARRAARYLSHQGQGRSLAALLHVELGLGRMEQLERPGGSHTRASTDALRLIGASRLRRALRGTDAVGVEDLSGFACVLPGLRVESAMRSIRLRLLAALGEPCVVEGRTLHLQPAVGGAVFTFDGRTLDVLVAAVAQARQQAHHEAAGLARVRAAALPDRPQRHG